MLRHSRAPQVVEPLQTPTASSQHQKPSFQPGTSICEIHSSTGQVTNRFKCGRLLGRGGFAKCYEVFDGKGTYALKAINRASLDKPKTLQKLHSEIAIHSRMKHKHIVNFLRTFKDRHYVYILLEKCSNGTLMDLLKVRPLTVPETQYIMLQCLSAMQYMHDNNVIHRDLKPGNIMLDGDLQVKIGDFGLAAELMFDGERKRTVCGTPNYIAPEIIDRKSHGHSFEVDIWSLGVILYTLLVGQPPFQMEDVESTYSRIRACRYDLPSGVPENARDLIRRVLQSTPTNRPDLVDIRTHPFFSSPVPPSLPPPSFAAYGLTLPNTGSAESGSNSPRGGGGGSGSGGGGRNGPSSRQTAAAAEAPAGKNGGQAQREILCPINPNHANNGAPAPGGPVSPRSSVNVIQKLPPPPPLSYANYADERNGNRNRATGAANRASPPPLPTGAPITMPGRRHTVAAAAAAGADVNGNNRYSSNPWRMSGGYDVHFPLLHTGGTPPADKEGANAADDPAGARRRGHRATAEVDEEEDRRQLTQLHDRLHQTLCVLEDEEQGSGKRTGEERARDGDREADLPAPEVWVTECADFSSKYGMCYRLSTGHTGAHYNDSTKMVWEPITGRVEYYARVRVEVPQANGEPALYAKDQLEAFNMVDYPESLEKKITLIKYFKTYLGRTRTPKDKVEVVPCSTYIPTSPPRLSDPHVSEDFVYVKRWLRTPEALVFRLSNKTVQVCFNDHAEVILSSEWKVVTYTDPTGVRRTLPLTAVATESAEAAERLRYTKTILYKLIKEHYL